VLTMPRARFSAASFVFYSTCGTSMPAVQRQLSNTPFCCHASAKLFNRQRA